MALTAIALSLALAVAVPQQRTRPLSSAPEVLSVYTEDWGLDSAGQPGLIIAVWGDGYVVWSGDQLNGGAPFYRGQIPAERVASLLAQFRRDGVFSDARLPDARFGPDSRFTTILLRSNGRELKLRSWHEVAEAHGTLIASARGLEALHGATRLDALSRQPAEYLYYRAVWAELRAAIQGLVPPSGSRAFGEVRMVHAEMTWSDQ